MTIKLFRYQEKGVRKLHRLNGRMLIGDEMGLGKTIQALQYASELPEARPIVVVCPAIVKYNWEREAKNHYNMRSEVLEGQTPHRAMPRRPPDIYIINYDILQYWVKWLRRMKPKIVIVDECQNIGNRTSIRSKMTAKLCRKIPKIIALSGTPITNYVSQLWPILNILRPDLFPEYYTYAMRYCGPRRRRWGWEFKGASNISELTKLLKSNVMIRRLKSDVLHQLPKQTSFMVPITLTRREEYDHAVRDFIGWLKTKTTNKGRIKRASRAEAITKVGYLGRLAAELKLDDVIEWLWNRLETTTGKIIVFAIHKSIIQALMDQFGSMAVKIDGSVTKRSRQLAIDTFSNSKRIRILVANIKAGSAGWNGTAATTSAVIELGYVPGDIDQLKARTNRIGQTKETEIFFLVAKNTIEEKRCKILQSKQNTIRNVLDGKAMQGGLDIYDKLIEELQKEASCQKKRL